jgi:beta-phosphoglucomutase-like phosphatase (HAD superfamily)
MNLIIDAIQTIGGVAGIVTAMWLIYMAARKLPFELKKAATDKKKGNLDLNEQYQKTVDRQSGQIVRLTNRLDELQERFESETKAKDERIEEQANTIAKLLRGIAQLLLQMKAQNPPIKPCWEPEPVRPRSNE